MKLELLATAWREALDALRAEKKLGRFDEIAEDLEWNLTDVEQVLKGPGPHNFDALFPAADWSAETPARWFLGTLLAVRSRGFSKRDEKHEGDLEVTEPRLVAGDFEVTGNLEVKSNLFVMGNLTVGGHQRDTNSDYAHVIVAGNIQCGSALFTEGMLMAGGSVTAPLVAFIFNQGFAKVLGGLKATLLIEADHGGTRVFGPVDAKAVRYDEMNTDPGLELEQATPAAIAELLTIESRPVVDECTEGDDEDAHFDAMAFATQLMQQIAEEKKVFV